MNTDSEGNSTSGCGTGFCVQLQELDNSARHIALGAIIIFNRFTEFPLVGAGLLAQLLFMLQLGGHQCAVAGVTRLHDANQCGLLLQYLSLVLYRFPRQIQPAR